MGKRIEDRVFSTGISMDKGRMGDRNWKAGNRKENSEKSYSITCNILRSSTGLKTGSLDFLKPFGSLVTIASAPA